MPASIITDTADAVTQWNTPAISFDSNRRVRIGTLPLPAPIVFTLACCAAALAMAWPLILELPLGSR